MNNQSILRRDGPRAWARAPKLALFLFGIDNLGALQALFGEPIGDSIVEAI